MTPGQNRGVRLEEVAEPAAPAVFSLQKGMAEAAEELTFQFSEVVEAREQTLEDRFEDVHLRHKEDGEVSIEQVCAVLRLMEGGDGYYLLRGQARQFARAFSQDPALAMEMLPSPRLLPPRQRYALLRLAAETLADGGDQLAAGRLAADARALASGHGEQLRGLFGVLPALRTGSAGGALSGIGERYFQLLATKPSVRSVLDALAELSGGAGSGAVLNTMQKDWAGNIARLEQVGMFVAVSRLVGAVRTMLEHGKDLASFPGAAAPADDALAFKHTRAMIDIGNASVPGGLLDKLVNIVLGPQAAPQSRQRLFSYLHRQAQRWPDQVWTSEGGRGVVLEQLARKQRA
jgi:hypothetical protein